MGGWKFHFYNLAYGIALSQALSQSSIKEFFNLLGSINPFPSRQWCDRATPRCDKLSHRGVVLWHHAVASAHNRAINLVIDHRVSSLVKTSSAIKLRSRHIGLSSLLSFIMFMANALPWLQVGYDRMIATKSASIRHVSVYSCMERWLHVAYGEFVELQHSQHAPRGVELIPVIRGWIEQ